MKSAIISVATKRVPPLLLRRKRGRDGYTIIVVMIVLILLSGLGIIALNTVNVGVREASLQQLHEQAFQTSNSAMLLFSEYAGSNASQLFQKYKVDYQKNGSRAGGLTASENRSNWALHIPENQMLKLVYNTGTSSTASLFANAPNEQTWENRRDIDYGIVIRDLTDGIPAPNFSKEFCFKRVLIGGESTVGLAPNSTANPTTYANAITAQETLIGPIRCN